MTSGLENWFLMRETAEIRELREILKRMREETPSNNRAELQKSHLDVVSGTTEEPNG